MANNKKRGRGRQNKQARRVRRSQAAGQGADKARSGAATRPAAAGSGRTASGAGSAARKGGPGRGMVAVVVVLAVLMVLSVLLPSLSSILAGATSADATAQQGADQAADASQDASAEGATDGMAQVDASYGAHVDELKARLDAATDDAGRLAPLLNLGNGYMDWASAASAYATDEDSQAHVRELYGLARESYESYLELNESSDVRTRCALCQYYAGDTDAAIAELEGFTASEPGSSYAPAWAYLGMMYQGTGDADAASKAYTQAVATDPDDAYGVKSYATEQIASLTAAQDGGDASGSGTSQQSLQSVLDGAATSGN